MSELTLEELDDWKQNDPGGLDADEILKLIAAARAHLEGKHILDLWEWFRQRGNYAACSEIFCYARDHGFKLDYPKHDKLEPAPASQERHCKERRA